MRKSSMTKNEIGEFFFVFLFRLYFINFCVEFIDFVVYLFRWVDGTVGHCHIYMIRWLCECVKVLTSSHNFHLLWQNIRNK